MVHRSRDCDGDDQLAIDAGINFNYAFDFSVNTKNVEGIASGIFEIRESFSRLNSMVEENIGGNRVVKAFSQEPYEIEKFNKHNEDYKKWNMASADVSKNIYRG